MATAVSGKNATRADIEHAYAQFSGLLHASLHPLTIHMANQTSHSDGGATSNVLSTLKYLTIRNLQTLKDMLMEGLEGGPVDDRTYIMERVIQLAAELPLNSKAGTGLTRGLLTQLWNSLSHPPLSSLGTHLQYRSADGSYNNPLFPGLGAAGSPYARTVRPQTMQPIGLPDPAVVFDSVMARGTFKPHPNRISSMLFYLASIIIHDLFRTGRTNPAGSITSSYLDLAPLYGSSQEDQNLIRTFEDGKIKPDVFSERRLHGIPPGVGVLVIMFNRFHNHTVEQLALINENGRFTKPTDMSKTADSIKYDNDLFQTGRLITCGLYINIILKDYVRTILNLNRTKSTWTLDPRSEDSKSMFSDGAPEGVGNQVSAEFNLVYRWHSCLSQADERWSEDLFHQLFPGRSSVDVSVEEFTRVMGNWESKLPQDPADRPFADLQRTPDGKFNDDDLAAIFTQSVEDCAGAFGANHVPKIFRIIEVLGIKQARSWNMASLNEFRKHFKLAPYSTFEEINPDPQVAEQLQRLYDHPDFVELYPGVIVEAVKEPVKPGSGLCTNFTISRAILSDAVTLVRGDRFYTIDYTPKNLTNWGFSFVNHNIDVDYGCVFYKLAMVALPENIGQNSVYAHYPMVIPSENEKILTDLGIAGDFSFDRPTKAYPPLCLTSYALCKTILGNEVGFKVVRDEAFEFLMKDCGARKDQDSSYTLTGGCPGQAHSPRLMRESLYSRNWEREVRRYYENGTLGFLHRTAYKIAGENHVDIVKDVSNLLQVHFASCVFSLPLKTDENPRGLFADTELSLLLAVVFTSLSHDGDSTKSIPLLHAARNLTRKLGQLMELNVRSIEKTGILQSLLQVFYRHNPLADYGVTLIRSLLAIGTPPQEVVWSHILPTVGAIVANQSELFSRCLDYYLSDEGNVHLPEIRRLSKQNNAVADDILLHYFMEGSRLSAGIGLFREATRPTRISDGISEHQIGAGQRVLCNLAEASIDLTTFPDPHVVVLDRDLTLYFEHGIGTHQCLDYGWSRIAATAMFKTVGQLDNLRRAPGPQGEIKKIPGPHGFARYMTVDQSGYFPFPTSMKIQWDGELPPLTLD